MSAINNYSSQPVLTDEQESEVANARRELQQALNNMDIAIRKNKSTQVLTDDLRKKSKFAAIVGSLSGSTDRDIAKLVSDVCKSLEATQIAVQIMLRLQTRKDYVLREFHNVLVE